MNNAKAPNDSNPVRGVNRNYKDTLFRMLFKDPKALLELYNAMNGTSHKDVNELEIVTLENAVYMNMKNDVAFLIDCGINLYEQQSTVNPNMPLRNLFYVAREYQMLYEHKSIYASKQVRIPAPHFVVFYNGTQKQPARLEMKLSDAFEESTDSPSLELKVIQLNIGEGYNEDLKEKCPLLKEYVEYTDRVRKYARKMQLDDAVEQAVLECIKEGILEDFLRKNRAEAISVSIFEYDEEKEIELFRQAEREVGIDIGKEIGKEIGEKRKLIQQVCKKLSKGKKPELIAEELEEELDIVKSICEMAQECGMDVDKIYEVSAKGEEFIQQ